MRKRAPPRINHRQAPTAIHGRVAQEEDGDLVRGQTSLLDDGQGQLRQVAQDVGRRDDPRVARGSAEAGLRRLLPRGGGGDRGRDERRPHHGRAREAAATPPRWRRDRAAAGGTRTAEATAAAVRPRRRRGDCARSNDSAARSR